MPDATRRSPAERPARRTVRVDVARLGSWLDGFAARHGGATVVATEVGLDVETRDGSTAEITVPFPWRPGESPDLAAAVAAVQDEARRPRRTLVVVARRGGYLCAVVQGDVVSASKLGRRHVQGRTAAGGWSQQRYARRRQKQTDELVEAVVDWATRLTADAAPPDVVVPGGDRALAGTVLADARLRFLAAVPRAPHLDVGDPDRRLVDELPRLVTRVVVRLHEVAGPSDTATTPRAGVDS